jgi:hypothetical protein
MKRHYSARDYEARYPLHGLCVAKIGFSKFEIRISNSHMTKTKENLV